MALENAPQRVWRRPSGRRHGIGKDHPGGRVSGVSDADQTDRVLSPHRPGERAYGVGRGI